MGNTVQQLFIGFWRNGIGRLCFIVLYAFAGIEQSIAHTVDFPFAVEHEHGNVLHVCDCADTGVWVFAEREPQDNGGIGMASILCGNKIAK